MNPLQIEVQKGRLVSYGSVSFNRVGVLQDVLNGPIIMVSLKKKTYKQVQAKNLHVIACRNGRTFAPSLMVTTLYGSISDKDYQKMVAQFNQTSKIKAR